MRYVYDRKKPQTGAGKDAWGKYRDKWEHIEPDYIASNVVQAVKWLLDPSY